MFIRDFTAEYDDNIITHTTSGIDFGCRKERCKYCERMVRYAENNSGLLLLIQALMETKIGTK